MLLYVPLKASDNAKEAEDNARKAKGAVKTVLGTITSLLEQLGKYRLHQDQEKPVQTQGGTPKLVIPGFLEIRPWFLGIILSFLFSISDQTVKLKTF